ncbi:CTLH/CRA C-terminal to lish motif domain-containing protein [Phlyctochytrium arcticum]|nr:CTLH/CRA C-terminal to lish motif domain-containing protein [Phlyctochytrium arcticum]
MVDRMQPNSSNNSTNNNNNNASTPHTPTSPSTPPPSTPLPPPPGPDTVQESYHSTSLSLPPAALQTLIYNHLVHHCYNETARALNLSCKLDASVPCGRVSAGQQQQQQPRWEDMEEDVKGSDELMEQEEEDGGDEMDMEVGETASLEAIHLAPLPTAPAPSTFNSSSSLPSPSSPLSPLNPQQQTIPLNQQQQNPTPAQSLPHRKHLQTLVMAGHIQDAMRACHVYFPGVLNTQSDACLDVLFELQSQVFIECVRNGGVGEALHFAQDELGKFISRHPRFLAPLNRVIALMAYANPAQSPVAHYLSPSRRDNVASALNCYILAHYGLQSTTALERLVRQATVTRTTLHEMTCTKDVSSKKTTAKNLIQPIPRWGLETLIGDVVG